MAGEPSCGANDGLVLSSGDGSMVSCWEPNKNSKEGESDLCVVGETEGVFGNKVEDFLFSSNKTCREMIIFCVWMSKH